MFKIEIKGLKELQAEVDDLVKHRIPKVTAIALTEVAKSLKANTEKQLSVVFDRPTTWTLNSVYYQPASADNLNAYVWFKDESAMGRKSNTKNDGTPASEYLWPQIHGGARNLKRFEIAFKKAGFLPEGYYIVPGEGVRLDQHGNIPRQMILKILSAAKAAETIAGYTMNQSKRSRKRNKTSFDVFVGKPGVRASNRFGKIKDVSDFVQAADKYRSALKSSKYPLGVWERSSARGLIPLLIFVKKPQYTKRFPFYDWGQKFVDEEFPKVFKRLSAETLAYHNAKAGR